MNKNSVATLNSVASIVFLTNQIQKISQDLEDLKISQQSLHTKLDSIKNTFSLLAFNIGHLKKEDRDTDEKIILAYRCIDKITDKSDKGEVQQSIDDYELIYKEKLVIWNKLDDLTKKFLCTADFLYSSLQHIRKVDFSPAVIEFCRALENELFLKIFKEYILDFIAKYGEKTQDVLVDDISMEETRKLAYQIIAERAGQKVFLTLGEMQFYLYKLLKKDFSRGLLLESLFNFIKGKFVSTILISSEAVWGLKRITDQYRNKAAHLDILNIDHTRECKNAVIKYIELIYTAQNVPEK